jgi:disulfide oxidoreductase YuzD
MIICVNVYEIIIMKSRSDNKQNWISNKVKKSRELVYKLIDINKEIDAEGKTFRLGAKVYFVRELG